MWLARSLSNCCSWRVKTESSGSVPSVSLSIEHLSQSTSSSLMGLEGQNGGLVIVGRVETGYFYLNVQPLSHPDICTHTGSRHWILPSAGSLPKCHQIGKDNPECIWSRRLQSAALNFPFLRSTHHWLINLMFDLITVSFWMETSRVWKFHFCLLLLP